MDFAAERYWPAAAQIGGVLRDGTAGRQVDGGAHAAERMQRSAAARRTVEGQASRIRKILNLLSILVPGGRREGESGGR